MSEIMDIIHEREIQKRKTKTEKNKGDKSYSERVISKWSCCAFKFRLSFLQVICKASLIFKSNIKLALSIIFKERELYASKHITVECRCLKYETSYPFWYVSQS